MRFANNWCGVRPVRAELPDVSTPANAPADARSVLLLDESHDPLWRVAAYRYAIQVLDHASDDTAILLNDGNARSLADQLYRSAGSVAANIAEGYSRSSGSDRVRLLEYALGSARECRVWYRAARRLLPADSVSSQHATLTSICKLLLTMIPEERKRLIRKARASNLPELT